MESAKELSKKEKIQGRIFIGTLIVIVVGILCLTGEIESNYIEKNGVWTFLTVDNNNTIRNPKNFKYHFTFRGEIHKGVSQSSIGDTLTREGRRIFMMVVPDKPNKHLIFSDAVPYWFTAEAPYNGWKTFPTDEELWAEMKAQGAEPGQPKDWSDHPNKRQMIRTRIVTWILVTIGCGVITFLYLVDKKKIKL